MSVSGFMQGTQTHEVCDENKEKQCTCNNFFDGRKEFILVIYKTLEQI